MTAPAAIRRKPLHFARKAVPGMISVVWPSRERVPMASAALASLRRTCLRPDLVEYGVAYDADDPATGRWAAREGLFTWEAPERLGWTGHNTYSAMLFEQSRGEWLLSWGDDGIMLTGGWDQAIRKAKPGVCYLGGHPTGHNVFPAVHRAVLEAIGEQLPSPHQDTWLTDVAAEAGCLRPVPVRIMEDRFDLTGNNRDAIWEQGSIHAYRAEEYYSAPMAAVRAEHAARVKKRVDP